MQILSHLLRSGKVYDKSKSRLRLLDVGLSGPLMLMPTELPPDFAKIYFEQYFSSTLEHPGKFSCIIALFNKLHYAELSVKIDFVRKVKSILCFTCSIDWLIDWLIDGLIDWLNAKVPCGLIDLLIVWYIGWLIDWFQCFRILFVLALSFFWSSVFVCHLHEARSHSTNRSRPWVVPFTCRTFDRIANGTPNWPRKTLRCRQTAPWFDWSPFPWRGNSHARGVDVDGWASFPATAAGRARRWSQSEKRVGQRRGLWSRGKFVGVRWESIRTSRAPGKPKACYRAQIKVSLEPNYGSFMITEWNIFSNYSSCVFLISFLKFLSSLFLVEFFFFFYPFV